MKNFYKLTAAMLFLLVIVGVFALSFQQKNGGFTATEVEAQTEDKRAQTASASTNDSWLKGNTDEKFAQIEKHLRGLDTAMAEIGYRYGELHFAAKQRNWEYAKYQTGKIDLTMRLALERRPKRAASSKAFLDEDVPAVLRAIENKNVAQMNAALERFHNSCVACHRSENVLHFRGAVERIRNNARR